MEYVKEHQKCTNCFGLILDDDDSTFGINQKRKDNKIFQENRIRIERIDKEEPISAENIIVLSSIYNTCSFQ